MLLALSSIYLIIFAMVDCVPVRHDFIINVITTAIPGQGGNLADLPRGKTVDERHQANITSRFIVSIMQCHLKYTPETKEIHARSLTPRLLPTAPAPRASSWVVVVR